MFAQACKFCIRFVRLSRLCAKINIPSSKDIEARSIQTGLHRPNCPTLRDLSHACHVPGLKSHLSFTNQSENFHEHQANTSQDRCSSST